MCLGSGNETGKVHVIEQQRYEHKGYQGSYNNVLIGKSVHQENGAPPAHPHSATPHTTYANIHVLITVLHIQQLMHDMR